MARTVRGVRQRLPPNSLVGRINGSGAAQIISLEDIAAALATSGNFAPVAASPGSTVAAGTGISVSLSGMAYTVSLANMAAHTFKGNNTGSTGAPLDLTATQATAELNAVVGDSGSGGTKGLAPGPAAGDAVVEKFLKADGTYQVSSSQVAWHKAAVVVAAVALPGTPTYSNGSSGTGATLTASVNATLVVDGTTAGTTSLTVASRVLVAGQADAKQNGIYVVTQNGDGSHPYILTRATDCDGNANSAGLIDVGFCVAVPGGSTKALTIWEFSGGTPSPLVIGTSTLNFSQVASPYIVTYSGGSVVLALASVSDNDIWIYDNASTTWKNQRQHYDIACFVPGVLVNSQKCLYHRFSKAVTIPANFGSYLGRMSEAGGSANATASTVINVDKAATATPNTFSNVGTITIAAASVTPTFATSGGTTVSFAQGDVLRVVGPGTADATFADFYATLCGFET